MTFLEPGAIYERAAEVAERALVVDPDSGFAFGDIIPSEDDLASAFHNPLAAQMIVEGILTGCVVAISQLALGPAVLAEISGRPPAPEEVIVEPEQFDVALSWLKTSIAGTLDDTARSELVTPVVWGEQDLTRRSAFGLALILLADIVCREARNRDA